MLRKNKVRSLLAAGSVLAAVSGLAFAQASPAKADPYPTLITVGDETTQGVWDAFTDGPSAPLAPGLADSYDATNPLTGAVGSDYVTATDGWAAQNNIVPDPSDAHPVAAGDCSFLRPDGTADGVYDLRLALGPQAILPSTVSPGDGHPGFGCVDIARASSGVDVTDNQPSVDIQWVPFAIDGVTGATGPASCSPASNCPSFTADLGNGSRQNVTTVASTLGPAIGDMTMVQISSLYNCNPVSVTVGGTTTTYIGTVIGQSVPNGDVGVDLYQPYHEGAPLPPGWNNAARDIFWQSTAAANYSDSTVDTATGCVHDYIVGGVLSNTTEGFRVPVEEDDGTAVAADPIGYEPFSIAQYISQQNPAHNPRLYGAVLQDINGVSPFVTAGSPSSGLNTSFPILRYVYNVVKLSRLTASGDPINTLLNGAGSTICHAHSTITSYGFALMSTSVFQGVACGAILPTNEAAP